jgi:predicted RNA binding protein YcfA (HicA-like mRNA interferase family)
VSSLPRISGRECVKALEKEGFYLKRREGSHMILRRDDPFGQLVVPDHKNWIAELYGQSSVRRD